MTEERATDFEIATCFAYHIREPCVEPITGQNIRHFYIQEARKVIPKLKNPFARAILEDTLKLYE